MSAVKQVTASDAFLEFDQTVKHCQNEELSSECETRKFIEDVEEYCQCKPFNIRNFTRKETMCDIYGLECAENVFTKTRTCIKPCTGLYADVTKHNQDVYDEEMKKWEPVLESYLQYKNMFKDDITYPPEFKGILFELLIHN